MLVAAATVLAGVWPAAGEALIYDRAAVFQGEIWRLWTGHVVHLSAAHLGWNLAVVVSIGGWLERVAPRPMRWFLGLAPGVISSALLGFAPDLGRYAGLSGVAVGLVVLLALDRLTIVAREPSWVWIIVLGLVAAKVVAEALTSGALIASLGPEARVVPLAHIVGCVTALAVFFTARPGMLSRMK